jgi:hypothetical protein
MQYRHLAGLGYAFENGLGPACAFYLERAVIQRYRRENKIAVYFAVSSGGSGTETLSSELRSVTATQLLPRQQCK